jgi:hypothetical protein
MSSAWRNFKDIFSGPLFTINFGPFHFEGKNDGFFTDLKGVNIL